MLFRHLVSRALIASLLGLAGAHAAVPFNSATVTKLDNSVYVGEKTEGSRKAAKLTDVVRQNNFVLTEDKSRAELQFPDNSLVRVGQNTIFTFDGGSRTFDLRKGAMLFYMPPGAGGGTIKTPTLTAAITGTICLVSENMIVVLVGSITMTGPDGKTVVIGPGHQFDAVMWTGSTIEFFKSNHPTDGYLVQMGPLPESPIVINPELAGIDVVKEILRQIETAEIVQVDPRIKVPKPKPQKKEKEEHHEEPPQHHHQPSY